MRVSATVCSKGGVGKTTTTANLGGLLADAGLRVLLIDLDSQPILSSCYELSQPAPGGVYELLTTELVDLDQIISHTAIPNLDIIVSNDYRNQLQQLLLTAREFVRGTQSMLNELRELARYTRFEVPPVSILLNKMTDQLRDVRDIADSIRTVYAEVDDYGISLCQAHWCTLLGTHDTTSRPLNHPVHPPGNDLERWYYRRECSEPTLKVACARERKKDSVKKARREGGIKVKGLSGFSEPLHQPFWTVMKSHSRMFSRASLPITLCAIVTMSLVLAIGYQARAAGLSEDARQTVDQLLRLVDARLAIAPDVAEAKWNSGAPIDAPEREAQILDGVVVEATQAGVDKAFAQTFFQHQFDASKIVQHRLHDRWRRVEHPPFDAPPDLADDIRPELDRLTPQLIVSLRDFQRVAESAGIREYLENRAGTLVQDGVGGVAREEALRPLIEATDA